MESGRARANTAQHWPKFPISYQFGRCTFRQEDAVRALSVASQTNVVGMRRGKFSADTIRAVRATYRLLFLGNDAMTQRLDDVDTKYGTNKDVAQIIAFIRRRGRRPICQAGRASGRDNT